MLRPDDVATERLLARERALLRQQVAEKAEEFERPLEAEYQEMLRAELQRLSVVEQSGPPAEALTTTGVASPPPQDPA